MISVSGAMFRIFVVLKILDGYDVGSVIVVLWVLCL